MSENRTRSRPRSWWRRERQGGRCRRSGSRPSRRCRSRSRPGWRAVEELEDRRARVEIAPALLGIGQREQDWPAVDAVMGQRLRPDARERDLADGSRSLALLQPQRPAARPSTERPSAIEPEETTSTSAPRACSSAISSASAASQAWLSRPRARSTRSDEPTLTTTRAELRRARAAGTRSMAQRSAASRIRRGVSSSRAAPISAAGDRCCACLDALVPTRTEMIRGAAWRSRLQLLGLCCRLWVVERVGLGKRDDLRLFRKAVAIGFELGADDLVGRAGMLGRAVDQMQEHAAALDMAEKAVAEPVRLHARPRSGREYRRARIRARRSSPRRAPDASVVKG